MNDDVSNSRIAVQAARTVFRAYESFTTRFTVLTERARSRFENQDVEGMRADSRQRLDLYKGVVDRVEEKLRGILESRIENEKTWASTKAVFSAYSSEREDWDIAETFFNSMTRRIFSTWWDIKYWSRADRFPLRSTFIWAAAEGSIRPILLDFEGLSLHYDLRT